MYSKVNFAALRLLDCLVGLVPELKTGYGWWQLLFDVRCRVVNVITTPRNYA
jgi:hypothetical protein